MLSERQVGQLLDASFYFQVLAVALPMLHKLYDAIIVQIIVNCVRKRFNLQKAATTTCSMLLVLPSTLFALGGSSVMGHSTNKQVIGAATHLSRQTGHAGDTIGEMSRFGKRRLRKVKSGLEKLKASRRSRRCDSPPSGVRRSTANGEASVDGSPNSSTSRRTA